MCGICLRTSAPFRFGDAWLDEELAHAAERYAERPGFSIYVDAPGNTRLPFDRYSREELDVSKKVIDLRGEAVKDYNPVPYYTTVIIDADAPFTELVNITLSVLPGGVLEVPKPFSEQFKELILSTGIVLAGESDTVAIFSYRRDLFYHGD